MNASPAFPPLALDADGFPSPTGYGAAPPEGHSGAVRASDVDVKALEAALRRTVSGEVRFDAGSRAAYSTDASNYRQVPIGVVLPRTEEDVIAAVAACRAFGAPITSRGGGTSLAGQCTNVAVILDYSKYFNQLLELDIENRTATVRPGIVLDELRKATRAHGLTFGPDPATHSHNTIGGMIGNDSCGVHSVMAQFFGPGPRTGDSVLELDVLTYEGDRFTVGPTSGDELARIIARGDRRADLYRRVRDLRDHYADQIRTKYPDIPRRVSGYNLPSLLPENGFDLARALVGSEGTLVVILKAKVALMPEPKAKSLLVIAFPSVFEAADRAPDVMRHRPIGLEGFDGQFVRALRQEHFHTSDVELLPEPDAAKPESEGWLLCEFGGDTPEEAAGKAREVMEEMKSGDDAPAMRLFEDGDGDEAKRVWVVREAALGVTARVPGWPISHPGWEDAAVAPENLGAYLRGFRDLLDRYGYEASLYGHFGQGCVHCRVTFDFETRAGVERFVAFLEDAADLVVEHGGSISGEHGDGQARAALLGRMFGDDLVGAFREFKSIWDPLGKMNPGKIVDPYRPDENLRTGPAYDPWVAETHFKFPDDGGSFHAAANRCVGVGRCRRHEGGVMCPSYMVTREEEDSTRGRARLLFEMFQGDIIADGWRDDRVREALDLCLACKGCKHECPVNVDMATYKAEFLSHYYEGRLRPRAAYAMGLIYWWARLASKVPGLANFVSTTKPFATAAKALGGIAQERKMPTFAAPTFTSWFNARGRRNGARNGTPSRGRVLLWPDTFNNYLMTDAARAAVDVLEGAGFEVEIPPRPLCCGRPLYDWGMLDTAERLWRQTLEVLRPYIRAGVPVVGLEPSCVAAFRDELHGLFPHDADARRLGEQTFLFSEFLEREEVELPTLGRKAIVQAHCHHRAVMHLDAEVAVLDRLGLDFEVLDSGCCGMAGSFGFDADNYDVSIACGERVLLPAVREADDDTLVITDGFSCREQIEQETGRRALHLAEVIRLAQTGEMPERLENPTRPFSTPLSKAVLAASLALAAGLAWAFYRRR